MCVTLHTAIKTGNFIVHSVCQNIQRKTKKWIFQHCNMCICIYKHWYGCQTFCVYMCNTLVFKGYYVVLCFLIMFKKTCSSNFALIGYSIHRFMKYLFVQTQWSLYKGHLESKERFAIKKYLLIIGKKKNMQVLSHTFTYFST